MTDTLVATSDDDSDDHVDDEISRSLISETPVSFFCLQMQDREKHVP
jgi:hypothetical protein